MSEATSDKMTGPCEWTEGPLAIVMHRSRTQGDTDKAQHHPRDHLCLCMPAPVLPASKYLDREAHSLFFQPLPLLPLESSTPLGLLRLTEL